MKRARTALWSAAAVAVVVSLFVAVLATRQSAESRESHSPLLGKEAPPPAAAPGSSPIRQNLDLEAFREQTGLPLRTDVSLLQTGPASEGLQRDWPVPALGIEKHYGYAFQWFALSALIAGLYAWFRFIRPRRP